jgi:tetratricopeptide (TPR) repeat protein
MSRKKDESVVEAIAPDPVFDNLKKASDALQKNLKIVAVVTALLLGGVLAFQLINASSERGAAEVTTKLSEAVKAYDEATDPQKVLTTTVAGALDADYEKARAKFAELSKEHSGSGAAQLAKLYEADLARRLRKPADAEALYKEYVQSAKPGDTLLFVALEGAGYALEDQNKLDEAADYFSRIGEGSTAFYKEYGLKHKARVLEKKGDKEGAKAALQAIIAIEPPSSLRPFAEERVKSLQ